MRRLLVSGMLLCAPMLALGCSDSAAKPAEPDSPTSAVRGTAAHARQFVAPLRGRPEVPPVVTDAVGMAGFNVTGGGSAVEFMLMVGRLENLTMAHIHLAAPGQNGPVVAWLYPLAPPPVPIPGEFNGVLSEGTLTAANLVGPFAGEPLSTLLNAMRAGNTYVNVHSAAFPGGEVRGQIVDVSLPD